MLGDYLIGIGASIIFVLVVGLLAVAVGATPDRDDDYD